MSSFRTVVADDHAIVRHGIRSILETIGGYSVIAEIDELTGLKQFVVSSEPDLLILDYLMPGGDAFALADYLKRRFSKLRVLIYTALNSPTVLAKLSNSRIDCIVLKQDPYSQLVDALSAMRGGGNFVSTGAREYIKRSQVELTAREIQVLRMIFRGDSNLAVAEQLEVSPETVKTHRKNLMRKLNAQNVTELIGRARQLGVYEEELAS